MSFREYQDRYPAATMALAVVALMVPVCFVAWWFWPRSGQELQRMAYFYDSNTGELFAAPAGTLGPIETSSGPHQDMPAGVRAHVYCCGPYLEGTEKFIGYLEVPLDALPEDRRPPGMKPDPEIEGSDLAIRRPDDDRWVDPAGPEGQRIMEELRARCPESKQLNYLPPPPR